MYIHIYGPPNDLPRNILYGNYHVFLHIKHDRKNNNSQKGRSWGAGFCTWMFQYIWVVIIISNALLFNGNDWFKTFVWPLHHLVCFTLSPASPMRPTMPTTILVLGHIEKSKQNLDNLKQTQAKKTKNKTFERMFGFDSKDVCFGCPYIVFLVLKWKHQKKHYFFEWVWSIKM